MFVFPSLLSVSLSLSRLAPFELYQSCTGSQAPCAVNAIVLRRGAPFCGVASSLPLFSHLLCDEALQWANNIPLERGSLLLSGSTPTVVGPKAVQKCCQERKVERQREKEERKNESEGGR